MLKKLKDIFKAKSNLEDSETLSSEKLKIGAAALLVEAALMDENFDDSERQAITRVLQQKFELTHEESNELLNEAEIQQERAIDVHRFTQSINNAIAPSDRIEIIQMLWEVVYADGALDKYEAALINQLTGLLHVTSAENAKAKKAALNSVCLDNKKV